MTIKSTCFDHKNTHKGTWKTPGSAINQTIFIYRPGMSLISQTLEPAEVQTVTHHYLLKAVLRQRLSNVLKGDRIQRRKWDTAKFSEPELCKEYEGAME
jgi:hypothetical protein